MFMLFYKNVFSKQVQHKPEAVQAQLEISDDLYYQCCENKGTDQLRSPIKWRQFPDITLAVDWDVKHQFKQTKYHTGDIRVKIYIHISLFSSVFTKTPVQTQESQKKVLMIYLY